MFLPRESYDQRVLGESLKITPEPVDLRYVQDVFGNCVRIAQFKGRSDELSFESTVELDHRPAPLSEEPWATDADYPVLYGADDLPDLARCIERQHPDPERVLERWAQRFVGRGGSTDVLSMLSDMTCAIHTEFRYAGRLEIGTQAPLETLRLGAGSCRDFALLMMEAVRSLNLAARFVSGYIYSRSQDGPDRVGGGHTHAWVRVYLPRCGWVEFDPTNGIVGSTDLVRVAVARHPRQAMPLCGTWTGAARDYLGMEVEVDVRVRGQARPIRRVA